MIWLIPVALAAAAAVWVARDLLRNSRYVAIPARPANGTSTEENRLLAVLAARALGERAAERFIDPGIADTEIDGDAMVDAICRWVDGRYDCSDFRLVSLTRILYRYPDQLTDAQRSRIKRTLLWFKYWLDEPGEDSMCYWSENHQILFATAEYLIGSLFPTDRFTNNGMTGAEHAAKGKARVLTWLDQRRRFGFIEWHSNVYYTEDVGPLSNLIDFAPDPEVAQRARIVMDLLLFDVATQSFRGTFVSNSGRLYEAGKKSGQASSMRAIARLLALPPGNPEGDPDRTRALPDGVRAVPGEGEAAPGGGEVDTQPTIDATTAGMGIGFFLCENYTVPEVIRRIACDPGPTEVRASSGLNLAELRKLGLCGRRDDQVMIQWGMEAFANPEVVNNTIDLVNLHAMQRHEMLFPIRVINVGLLRRLGLLPLISRILRPQSNGTAIQRSNSYLFRTPAYTLSTSQSYHPGTYGDQQHIWQATVADDLSVFTTHPAALFGSRGVMGNSPTYWVGSGRLPHSVQYRNVNLTLYRLPDRPGPMEAGILPFTHAWFPESRFDEVVVVGRHAFGRRGEALIALTAGAPLRYGPEGTYRPSENPALAEAGASGVADSRTLGDTGRSGALGANGERDSSSGAAAGEHARGTAEAAAGAVGASGAAAGGANGERGAGELDAPARDGVSDPLGTKGDRGGRATPAAPREELVQPGRDTWWICEMSTMEHEGSFEAFRTRIAANRAVFAPDSDGGAGRLVYETIGDRYAGAAEPRRLEVVFRGDFTVDGRRIDTDYDRFDSPYCRAPREPSTMTIRADGEELQLDFARWERTSRPSQAP